MNQILFGKYELLSKLGSGSFADVYLSRHRYLECNRVLKLIPKSSIHSRETLLSEALLLKSLTHVAIPHVYDIEEDADYYCLVEEYLRGENLEVFLSHQSPISQTFYCKICLQLCDIFSYLHSMVPHPLLYLDLKPEHIIVCGDELKLIDFNVSTFLTNSGNVLNLFGNRDFSAPELFSGALPTPACDIYSIGRIMEYLSSHVDIPLSPKFLKVIHKAAQQNPQCRFETVDALASAITLLQPTQPTSSCKTIAIFGSHHGCGATHLAISLVSTLNYLGFSAVYYQKDKNNNQLRQLPEEISGCLETEGKISYRFFRGYPNYGPGVLLPDARDVIRVLDYGAYLPSVLPEADQILYLCTPTPWHRKNAYDKGDFLLQTYDTLTVIGNFGQENSLRPLARHFHTPIYEFPYLPDAFRVTSDTILFVRQFFSKEGRKHRFFHFIEKHIRK